MRRKLALFAFTILVLLLNLIVVASFQQKQEIRSNAQTTTDPAPTTSSGIPQPTFACLGACPTSPLAPTTHIPGTQQPGTNDTAPTPCPQTQLDAAYGDSAYEDDRRGKKKQYRQKHKNNSGLLEMLIKLLEILLQLVGGGTPPPPPVVTPPTPEPCHPQEPTEVPEPTEEPEPTQAPQPTEAPEPTEPPQATQAPVGGGDAAICGKKISGAKASSLSSCSGLTATQPTSNGLYRPTNFGCNIGFPKDPVDNCIPACSGTPECNGLSGRACEEKVIWYSANADQYGCNTKLKVTNPATGKAVIVRALDRGPGCSVQKSVGIFDISQAAYKEINGDSGVVHVEKVPESTPLGPIPVCTQ